MSALAPASPATLRLLLHLATHLRVLASDDLDRGQRQVLDPAKGLAIVSWQRGCVTPPRRP
jgi:hypothetical protein